MNSLLLEGASKNICFPPQTFFNWTPGCLPVRGGMSGEAEAQQAAYTHMLYLFRATSSFHNRTKKKKTL